MPDERIIKVFMASSDELEGDRAIFGNLIRRLNDMYKKRGIYIELYIKHLMILPRRKKSLPRLWKSTKFCM